MESQDFSQEDQPDSLSETLDEDDGLADSESDSVEDESPDDTDDRESADKPDSEPIAGRFASQEELVNAYLALEQKAQANFENDELRQRLQQLEQGAQSRRTQAEDEEFDRQLQAAYEKNPLETTNMMIKQAKMEHWKAMEARLQDYLSQLGGKLGLNDAFSRMLDIPSNAGMKPYGNQIQFLVTRVGLDPDAALQFVRSITETKDRGSDMRSAAARDIRNRSTVESPGPPRSDAAKDKELDRVLKETKTLEEMFEGLRKIRI